MDSRYNPLAPPNAVKLTPFDSCSNTLPKKLPNIRVVLYPQYWLVPIHLASYSSPTFVGNPVGLIKSVLADLLIVSCSSSSVI